VQIKKQSYFMDNIVVFNNHGYSLVYKETEMNHE